MTLSFSLFYFVFGFLLFFYHRHCAAIINRTIDHHQHQNDHVLNIQTASIMDEGARPSIVFSVSFGNGTAQHAYRPWSILLCDAVFFISSLSLLRLVHSTCYMPFISFKEYVARSAIAKSAIKSQRKWQKRIKRKKKHRVKAIQPVWGRYSKKERIRAYLCCKYK